MGVSGEAEEESDGVVRLAWAIAAACFASERANECLLLWPREGPEEDVDALAW